MNLIDAINSLRNRQLAQWTLAKNNFKALDSVLTKELSIGHFSMRVQCNPARAISSGAKVDAQFIARRPCFLCATNRPHEQEAIAIGDFEILINPFPIFSDHLTIASTIHTPQAINGRWCQLAAFAWQMPGYTIFYNGPKCGASAPDHFHFQAVGSSHLPIWKWCGLTAPGLCIPTDMPFGVISIVTDDFSKLSALSEKAMRALPSLPGESEPKVNILCRAIDGRIQLIIIPRKAHRPSIYSDRMISPASIDLAGVLITPRIEDFKATDATLVTQVLHEVCLTPAEISEFCTSLTGDRND